MLRIITLLIATLLTAPTQAGEGATLVDTFQSALIAVGLQQLASFEQRYDELEPIVIGTHDLAFIAQLTMGRHWTTLNETQRNLYQNKFARLSVASYAARFKELDGVSFEIIEEQPRPRDKVLVRAQLLRNAQRPLSFEYVLHETSQGWRIVNILVDGISDLALKRAEYARKIGDGGIDNLLLALDEQYAALAGS